MRDMEWLPIESAPEGTDILVFREDMGVAIGRLDQLCYFMTDEEAENSGVTEDILFEMDWFASQYDGLYRMSDDGLPTHWMPLPNPPNHSSESSLS